MPTSGPAYELREGGLGSWAAVMTTRAMRRRLAELEAEIALFAPAAGEAALSWLTYVSNDDLLALEGLFRLAAEDGHELTSAERAWVLSVEAEAVAQQLLVEAVAES